MRIKANASFLLLLGLQYRETIFFHSLFHTIMKRYIFNLILLCLCISVAIVACKKTDDSPTKVKLDALSLLTKSENAENNTVNKVLYLYAMSVNRTLSANPNFIEELNKAVLADKNGVGVSIPNFADALPEFQVALAKNLRNVLVVESSLNSLVANINLSSDKDLIQGLANLMVCRGISYFPVAHKVTSDVSAMPRDGNIVIAIGDEVNDNDEVLAYRNFEESPFLLSEADAAASADNIIFIGVGYDSGDASTPMIILGDDKSSETMASERVTVNCDVDRHQIKSGYRYETSSISEIRCEHVFFVPTTLNPNFQHRWYSDFDPRWINETDINSSKIFTDDKQGFSMELSEYSMGRYVFNYCWEHDWYAAAKLIKNDCSPFVDHSVGTRRHYLDEWYFIDCGVLKTMLPSVGSHYVIENDKCMFEIFRKL
jgi:hypothetical protein